MPSYKSVTYLCGECAHSWGELVERDKEHEVMPCPICCGEARVTISAVTVLKASYPDGTKREGFAELKEASKLEAEMFNKKPEDRGELKKAVKDLKSTKKRG
jgi:predicted nucleic acid-binding Zn ribbon protein